jgi:acyl carrier protein
MDRAQAERVILANVRKHSQKSRSMSDAEVLVANIRHELVIDSLGMLALFVSLESCLGMRFEEIRDRVRESTTVIDIADMCATECRRD